MKKYFLTIVLILAAFGCKAQISYNQYFNNDRLRLDLVFAGTNKQQSVYLESIHHEGAWSGTRSQMVSPFDYGNYEVALYSVADGAKIYSNSFCSLFSEWRTTQESKEVAKAFTNSVVIPCPKEKVKVVLSERLFETGKMSPLFTFTLDPEDKEIKRDSENDFKVDEILNNGPSEHKVDLVFAAEGYTAEEMDKFRRDVQRFVGYLFDIEPYKSRKADFNIWAVESVSVESGTDIPHNDIWKNTVAASNFYTFKIDRYLTAPDHKKVAQMVTNAPYDAIYVIVNTEKYGGGGIYNYYGLSMSDHPYTKEVFVHEFGHSFAGLGDEYYESDVAYEDTYNLNYEPWEPNLTTFVGGEYKWKGMVNAKTPIPTPNEAKYAGVVGVFEGGGYSAKRIYRPSFDCRMKTNKAPGFCPVCTDAINRMIDYYCR
ncbi:MAG: M64 family metallopeptidase [Bacteroidales bacterium]|nr:M64 family metallopeptidase [Bacteroidales bacterium]